MAQQGIIMGIVTQVRHGVVISESTEWRCEGHNTLGPNQGEGVSRPLWGTGVLRTNAKFLDIPHPKPLITAQELDCS